MKLPAWFHARKNRRQCYNGRQSARPGEVDVQLGFTKLEERRVLSVSVALVGNEVTFTGDDTGNQLELNVDESGGTAFLRHNLPLGGNLVSSNDLDSSTAGEQRLAIDQITRLTIELGSTNDSLVVAGGPDFDFSMAGISIAAASAQFDVGVHAGGNFQVAITEAFAIGASLTSDGDLEIQSGGDLHVDAALSAEDHVRLVSAGSIQLDAPVTTNERGEDQGDVLGSVTLFAQGSLAGKLGTTDIDIQTHSLVVENATTIGNELSTGLNLDVRSVEISSHGDAWLTFGTFSFFGPPGGAAGDVELNSINVKGDDPAAEHDLTFAVFSGNVTQGSGVIEAHDLNVLATNFPFPDVNSSLGTAENPIRTALTGELVIVAFTGNEETGIFLEQVTPHPLAVKMIDIKGGNVQLRAAGDILDADNSALVDVDGNVFADIVAGSVKLVAGGDIGSTMPNGQLTVTNSIGEPPVDLQIAFVSESEKELAVTQVLGDAMTFAAVTADGMEAVYVPSGSLSSLTIGGVEGTADVRLLAAELSSTQLTIVGDDGANQVTFGNQTNGLDRIQMTVTVDGAGGDDVVILDDRGQLPTDGRIALSSPSSASGDAQVDNVGAGFFGTGGQAVLTKIENLRILANDEIEIEADAALGTNTEINAANRVNFAGDVMGTDGGRQHLAVHTDRSSGDSKVVFLGVVGLDDNMRLGDLRVHADQMELDGSVLSVGNIDLDNVGELRLTRSEPGEVRFDTSTGDPAGDVMFPMTLKSAAHIDLTIDATDSVGGAALVLSDGRAIVTDGGNLKVAAGSFLFGKDAMIDADDGTVALTANSGSIGDTPVEDSADTVDIIANELALRSTTGIGSLTSVDADHNVDADSLEVDVRTLAAVNTTAGGIFISNHATDGEFVIGTVDQLEGVSNLRTAGGDTMPGSPHAGDIHIETAAANDLIVAAPVINDAVGANIRLLAGGELVVRLDGDQVIRTTTGQTQLVPVDVQLEPLDRGGSNVNGAGEATIFVTIFDPLGLNYEITVFWGDGVVDRHPPLTSANGFTEFNSTDPAGDFITYQFNHRYNGNPDIENPAADIPVRVEVRFDPRVPSAPAPTKYGIQFVEGFGTANAKELLTAVEDELTVAGEGIFTFIIIVDSEIVPVEALKPTSIFVDTGRSASFTPQGEVFELQVTDVESEVASTVVYFFRQVNAAGKEGKDEPLPSDILDRGIEAVFRKFPNGRYRVYVREPGNDTPQLIREINVFQGRIVPRDFKQGADQRQSSSEEASPEDAMQEEAVNENDNRASRDADGQDARTSTTDEPAGPTPRRWDEPPSEEIVRGIAGDDGALPSTASPLAAAIAASYGAARVRRHRREADNVVPHQINPIGKSARIIRRLRRSLEG